MTVPNVANTKQRIGKGKPPCRWRVGLKIPRRVIPSIRTSAARNLPMAAEEDPFAPEMAMLRMTRIGVYDFKLTQHDRARRALLVQGGKGTGRRGYCSRRYESRKRNTRLRYSQVSGYGGTPPCESTAFSPALYAASASRTLPLYRSSR